MEEATKKDRILYRKTARHLTKQQLEAELDEKLRRGEITAAEAEDEWQNFMHRGEDTFLGVYGW